ncbi:Pathogenic type III effector avirulence factor Avr AvrRpt-cleavage: cleavage site protein [Quillaja saponaria]|uniref:Pathogenic type III effector avirulence factor Avr AvrRpt-cleavage: cleavage site protein n=1 Tax=Quillaja saponaria TaxID=32244 RepID=A0AAD7P7M4_QUISA|nr:Pathogenic type III effector avirulence factor Avr AvrRpt-cleavage: cleavage site protein [Quillaja saponaria]
MEDRKEKNASWLSVPQFGDWDQKGQVPDYSMDFTKIREMRKQNKREVSRASIGNEEEFIASASTNLNTSNSDYQHAHYHQTQHSPTTRRSFLSYFNCFVKA